MKKFMKKLVLVGLLGLVLGGIAIFMVFKHGCEVGYKEAKKDVTFTCELTEDENAAYVPSDEESMNRRIREDFGSNYYGELSSNGMNGVIKFIVYDSDGTARYEGKYERFSEYTVYTPTANNLDEL